MLYLQHIRKSFGDRLVLDIPGYEFTRGIHWIKGENGSGKSTLLRIIAGLIPFSGTVRLHDTIDIKKNKVAYRKQVNYAEAEPLFPSFLSGHDLIRFYQSTKGAEQNTVDSLIEVIGIGSFIKSPVGTYSSGMVKKLSLLLSFIGNPRVILLDEPWVTLEEQSIPIINRLILQYAHQDATILMSSHQPVLPVDFPELKTLQLKDQTLWGL